MKEAVYNIILAVINKSKYTLTALITLIHGEGGGEGAFSF